MSNNFSSQEDGNISPQLPSFVDVVFILLIFFLVLSVVGFGVVEDGNNAEGVFEKEQDVSKFPSVQKALNKDIKDFLILSLESNNGDQNIYYVYSSRPYNGVIVASPEEYKTIHSRIESGELTFVHDSSESPIDAFEAAWGPFSSAEEMSRSRLILSTSPTNLIIQAGEEFTYHQILEIMRLFSSYQSVYFEVIENSRTS